MRKALASLPMDVNILDLGCGNGSLAAYLIQQCYRGSYTGVDFSTDLLKATVVPAGSFSGGSGLKIQFIDASLSEPGWEKTISPKTYSQIFTFAVLHHIPGKEMRLSILEKIRGLLDPGGCFILSNWQFLNSPRLASRIQPWSRVGMDPSALDGGDYLLDWRAGPDADGLRYVHCYSSEELRALAKESGFVVVEEYTSDGREGNLGLYQVWKEG